MTPDPLSRSVPRPGYPAWVAYEPELIPPPDLMRHEGIEVLEEWLRWAEEWSLLLRIYGGITARSAVLEIGCGLGRTAFPLRYVLGSEGSYDGFDICEYKIRWLTQTFTPAHANFRFAWANVRNTCYNPGGTIEAREFRFPYCDAQFDLVYAASVFTHMTPENAGRYFDETARVLKSSGRCLFSFFLLDHYAADRARPAAFAGPKFSFDASYGDFGADFGIARPDNPEEMTAYRLSLVRRLADHAGLAARTAAVPGYWSGAFPTWVGAQDLVVLTK